MKLIVLGSAGYHPNDQRQTTCLMLPELGIVLDAGTGMYRVRQHLATPHLDIFLSHAHLDHVVGLTYLLDVLYEKQMDRVTIHGEAHKLAAIQGHLFAEDIFPVLPNCDFRALTSETLLPNEYRVKHFPLQHPGGSVGYRFDGPDLSLAYVTDTTASTDADYVDAIRGVDVLIHECNFPDGWEEFAELTGHSCTTPVAQVAAKAGVGRLILIHMNPMIESDDPIGLATARAIFPATDVAFDGMAVEV